LTLQDLLDKVSKLSKKDRNIITTSELLSQRRDLKIKCNEFIDFSSQLYPLFLANGKVVLEISRNERNYLSLLIKKCFEDLKDCKTKNEVQIYLRTDTLLYDE
jgi:hypothetical protein